MEKKHTGLGAFLKGGVFLAVCLLIALNAELSIEAAKKSLGICVNVIIPSLFPFAIFATAVVKSGMGEQIGKIFSPVMRPLFKISGCGAFLSY